MTEKAPTLCKQRLARAVKNPRLVVAEGWHEDPKLLRAFFDYSEDQALHVADDSWELAHRAVELASVNGDSCLVNRAYGVLSHAYLSRRDLFWAGKTLAGYRQEALACCPRCRSELFQREGDFLGEQRKAAESLEALDRSLAEGEGFLSDDEYGRIYFVRGISYHHAGDRDRALADAGRALELLSLESPRGFFEDTVACLAIFIGGGDLGHDALALDHVHRLEQRVHGLDGWKAVHTRSFWAKGHFHARLGDVRRADRNLERSQTRLLAGGLDREVVAATLDQAQLRCRPGALFQSNLRIAKAAIGRCLRGRPGLAEDHVRRLKEIGRVIERDPEAAFREIGNLRKSFIAPVPGQLGERIGPE